MWAIRGTDEYEKRKKHYEKKHRRELMAVLDNLDTYHKTLNNGVKPKQAVFGFTHAEPCDVVAIDQKGGGGNLAQARLYVFPDAIRKVLYLITLGDKKSQRDDIALCKAFISQLPELEGNADGQEPDFHDRRTDGARDD